MKHNFVCVPTVWHEKPLVFTWDDVTGEVTGKDASKVLQTSQDTGLVGHPYPTYWEFDGGAGDGKHIKSRRNLALIVGHAHAFPKELEASYPVYVDDTTYDMTPGIETLQGVN